MPRAQGMGRRDPEEDVGWGWLGGEWRRQWGRRGRGRVCSRAGRSHGEDGQAGEVSSPCLSQCGGHFLREALPAFVFG